jgi:hypothetical protein
MQLACIKEEEMFPFLFLVLLLLFPPYVDASAANCSACPNVPGNVMTGICNCYCNFDINMFLKNVENSVSKILTEKEMVYHQRLEEMENRLRGSWPGLSPAVPCGRPLL